jgi:hypothetical protein
MKRFIQGGDRTQTLLLPECLDDYVAETNPVRVIDVFVDELDLGKLGFGFVETGLRPPDCYCYTSRFFSTITLTFLCALRRSIFSIEIRL